MEAKEIALGETTLGIELGSTRIKAVLSGLGGTPLASGSFEWENRRENGYWTYPEGEILSGLQACYASLKEDVFKRYGEVLHKIGGIGISAMMHGYLVFDEKNNLLVPFRTWRNNTAARAAVELTNLFSYPIPARFIRLTSSGVT